MKTWKLLSGILSCMFSVAVLAQSTFAEIGEEIIGTGNSGEVGSFVGLMMLAGGIVSLVTRSNPGKGKDIALIILFGIAAIAGYTAKGIYGDLVVWSTWCLINTLLAVVSLVKNNNRNI